jgi:hypothetical protein
MAPITSASKSLTALDKSKSYPSSYNEHSIYVTQYAYTSDVKTVIYLPCRS